jgi:hypothetical protein
MSIYSSIYIPRVDSEHTEESIAYYMSAHHIGYVSHVDFTPINKKPGFDENLNQVVKSAFVHFSDPWFCSDKQYYFQRRTYPGNSQFWNTISAEKSYKIQVSNNEYWICLKNKNPVQRTMMNIHQVVENGRYLEKLITMQAEEIKNLTDTVRKLEETLNTMLDFDLNCFAYEEVDTHSEYSSYSSGSSERIRNSHDLCGNA